MDESGSAIDIKQKLKVILFSEEKKTFAKQNRNREWVIIIKIIRIISEDIPPFLITKEKYILRDLAELIYQSRATLVYNENR